MITYSLTYITINGVFYIRNRNDGSEYKFDEEADVLEFFKDAIGLYGKIEVISDACISPRLAVEINKLVADRRSADAVNHPAHYGDADDPYEVIKVMEAWLTPEEFIGACKFNIFTYNAHAKKKGIELENYEKAAWYQVHLVDYCKRKGLAVPTA